eukprot:6853745-Prymnesium_polylepis.1
MPYSRSGKGTRSDGRGIHADHWLRTPGGNGGGMRAAPSTAAARARRPGRPSAVSKLPSPSVSPRRARDGTRWPMMSPGAVSGRYARPAVPLAR